jgi:hypothetical protein
MEEYFFLQKPWAVIGWVMVMPVLVYGGVFINVICSFLCTFLRCLETSYTISAFNKVSWPSYDLSMKKRKKKVRNVKKRRLLFFYGREK